MKWFTDGMQLDERPLPFWRFVIVAAYCGFLGLMALAVLAATFGHLVVRAKASEMLAVRDGAAPIVVVVLTDRRMTQLRETNETVNGGIRPAMPPRNGLDIPDVKAAGADGDCKDYAITKAYALQKAFGWPPESLLFVIVRPNPMSPDMRHAVLVARTDAGDFVLDNLTPNVTRWSDSPYAGYAEHWFTTEFHDRIFVPRSDGTFLRR